MVKSPAFLALPLMAAGLLVACGSTPQHAEMVSNAGPNSPEGPAVDRTRCNDRDKHVVTADVNQDQKPDVWRYFATVDVGGQKTEILTCKQVDLNRDGKIDLVYYYDDKGAQTTVEEADLDFDGKFDLTIYYVGGKKVREELDTNFDQKVDVWKYYEDEKLVREELDTNGDGKVDQWQYFEGGKLDRIGYDTSGSGKVDHWDRAPENEENEPGGGGGVAPAPATAPAAPTTPPPATSPPPAGAAKPAAAAKPAPAAPAKKK
jgi:hypothetical protein